MLDFKRHFDLTVICLAVFTLLISTGLPAYPGSDSRAKLGPTLKLLLARNRRSLEKGEGSLNLAPYADRLEIFSGERRVEVTRTGTRSEGGLTDFSYEVTGKTFATGLGVMIETDSPLRLEAKGVEVGTVAGDVVTATAELGKLRDLARMPSVEYIEVSRRLKPNLNKSVPLIGADELHNDNPVLRGSGIIVGVVDSGVDYDHRDFRVEQAADDGLDEETSRINFIWDQVGNNDGGGPGPAPSYYGYGTEYTSSDIENDIASGDGPFSGGVREADPLGHGTHVSGIAAGDGSSNPNPNVFPTYRGMAPAANIIAVKTTFTTSDIIDGVNYVFQKADSLGKPAVVNLSLGSHLGPHDGTSLFSRALSELTGPGKIIVASAGNEGSQFIHGGDVVRPGESSTVRFEVVNDPGRLKGAAAVNTWYSGESRLSVTVTSPGGNSVTAASGERVLVNTPGGGVSIDNASTGKYPENGDKELEVKIGGKSFGASSDIAPGIWKMTLKAPAGTEAGRFDSWYYLQYPGESFVGELGNNRLSVANPGVAKDLITVGAQITKTEWVGADGTDHNYVNFGTADVGNIAPFSSWGPTRDGRLKPDITAPGMGIASTLSGSHAAELKSVGMYGGLATRDGKHVIMGGTSMSAPHVSGQVALMLQENPNLTPEEVQGRLTDTADSDRYTSVGYDPESGSFDRTIGPVSNYTWGYGKLDSDGAGRTIGFETVKLDGLSVKLGPNPAPAGEEVYVYYQTPDGTSDPTFKVFNAAGREVYSAELSPNKDVYQWSLEADDGSPLANGVYLYVLNLGDQRTDVGKLLVERR